MRRNTRYRAWVAGALLAISGVVLAAKPSEVRKQVEMSRLISGTIDFNEEGQVTAHAFKDARDLSPELRAWLDDRVKSWRFEPVVVDGKPRLARTSMSMRVALKPLPTDNVVMRVASVSFFPDRSAGNYKPQEHVRSNIMTPPRYPSRLARAGVGGTVYMALRVGRDGKVAEAVAEQVNLRIVASEPYMDKFRAELAKASLDAARKWEFTAPTEGPEAGKEFWVIRTPVDFFPPDSTFTKPHEWTAYVPGPVAVVPWLDYEGLLPPDALASGGIYPVREDGIRLKTALD